ncbi:MAG: alpha/beta hydrolase [Betaproteobacteria bacterium]
MPTPDIRDLLGPNGFFEKRGTVGVLLIHGLTGTPAEMRHFGRQLARKGLTVACPQLAGHCDSVQALKASTWEDWYRSVDQAFEALSRECEHVYAAGLSMGALLGLVLAARKQERLAGVTLLSPTFFYDGWNMPKWRRRLLLPLIIYSPLRHFISWEEPPPYGIKDERVRAMVSAVLENRDARTADKIGHFKTPATVIRESKRLIRAAKNCLGEVQRPTLVVHSTEDDMASIENAHFVTRRIGAPKVETYFVDDTYHVLTLDKKKDKIADRVASFCQPALA